jgi:sialate O-acetylesterase
MRYSSIVFLVCVFAALTVEADVTLPRIFGKEMVLQRQKPISVWGWASPGEKVTVMLNGRTGGATADKTGRWLVKLPALEAGGPYDLVIRGKNTITLTNVLIGDVWLCGGQSNMQWTITQTGYQEQDTAFVNKAPIRLFTVHVDMDYMPKVDLKGTGWMSLTQENIQAFSAVAYHFGKYVQQHTGVPIGLISDNLGATAIETWMSNESLMKFPQFTEIVGPVVKDGKNFDALNRAFEKSKPAWYTKYYYKGTGIEQEWFKPETDITDWKPIQVSGNTWENEPELRGHDGAVWFRTTFDLPEGYKQPSFRIGLCQIDDYDIGWVNGVKVGENYGAHNHRGYDVPVNILKPKGNVLVVRVFDIGGTGGFTTPSFWGNDILLGQWVYKKGKAINAKDFPAPKVPNATPFSSPAVLFNANIAPLTSFPIKGVIWYQGESNVERAYEYRELLPEMISDWRRRWGQGDFPFLFVQLANYIADPAHPGHWPELREAQAMALKLPNTGMAVAIDVGETNDIHPKNKEAVGQRLGRNALKVAYGHDVVFSGPVFKEMRIEGEKAIITFRHTGSGLITKDKYGYVHGFQVAGDDGKFQWAKAHIEGNTVVVYCDAVKVPVAVRYAWENNPMPVDLYNKEGLPASPFRTDQWKGSTEGVVFRDGPRF